MKIGAFFILSFRRSRNLLRRTDLSDHRKGYINLKSFCVANPFHFKLCYWGSDKFIPPPHNTAQILFRLQILLPGTNLHPETYS